MNRRDFLKLTAAATLASPRLRSASSSAARLWGDPLPTQLLGMLPVGAPESVFELFLLGGLNAWDTFYVVPEFGDPARGGPYAGQQWWTFQSTVDNIPDFHAACGGGQRPLLVPWARDSAGRQVHLGPFIHPLRDRPDLLARMRVFVVSHEEEPHQAAVPLVMGGHRRGSRRLAGMGAHVARYWQEHGDPTRTAPYSYALAPDRDTVTALDAEVVSAVGLHPGSARPLSVRIRAENPLATELARPAFGGRRDAADAALEWYAQRYGERLGSGLERPRSRAYQDYRFALEALRKSSDLGQLFTPEVLQNRAGAACGTAVDTDVTAMGLELATHLLTSPVHQARYTLLVETGLVEAGCGGYDTHEHHVQFGSRNVVHTFGEFVKRINEPGEADPRKLDLDKHLVLVTTEMGRTPFPQSGSEGLLGLNHWPYGFVCIAFGGFVDEDRAGIVGAIGEDGRATEYVTPGELRAALLLASGIWPFSLEAFNVATVRGASTELDAALRLRQLLGYPA